MAIERRAPTCGPGALRLRRVPGVGPRERALPDRRIGGGVAARASCAATRPRRARATTRAAAQTSVMLIEYQMPPSVAVAPCARLASRSGSARPAQPRARAASRRDGRRRSWRAATRACAASAAPHRIAHGCTSSQQSRVADRRRAGRVGAMEPASVPRLRHQRAQLVGLGARLGGERRLAEALGEPGEDAQHPGRHRRVQHRAAALDHQLRGRRRNPAMATSFQSALRMRTWPRSPRPTKSTKKRNWRRRCSRSGTGSARVRRVIGERRVERGEVAGRGRVLGRQPERPEVLVGRTEEQVGRPLRAVERVGQVAVRLSPTRRCCAAPRARASGSK